MAERLARPHTHLSNRAKARSALERKPVFKSVLENPFQIKWPSIPANIQNVVLARLVAALENVSPRLHASEKISHKTNQFNVDNTEERVQTNSTLALDRPYVSSASAHLVIGINAVTRALEHQLLLARKRVVLGDAQQIDDQLPLSSVPSPIVVVFACRADVDPTALIDHIPYLVAGCNSPRGVAQSIKLVPLPKGSEQTISQILGVRRAAVVAFRHESPLFETVQDTLDAVPIVSARWLCPSDTPHLEPTHIKQLRTTAPKDMKGAKEQRAKARATAKTRSLRRKPRMTLTTELETSMQNDDSNCQASCKNRSGV